jgi:hypothetical protein
MMSEQKYHRLIGGLLGRDNLDYLTKAARERRHNRRERKDVGEAQWNVKTFDWPVSHPDDVADDDGFRLLGSDRYLRALSGLGGSFQAQPVGDRTPPADEGRRVSGNDDPS